MTSNEEIQEIIDKTDMVELVGEYVSLEKSGANYRGLCPFHDEKTPSFMVSPQKHLATCFGCHKSLNPIQFIQEIKNISFPEALAIVAAKAGVKINISQRKSNEPDLSKYYSMISTAESFYYKNLTETTNGEEALKYLHNRGLNNEVIEKFGIGLSSDKNDIVFQIYKKLGYLELDMQHIGMVNISKGGAYHDIFTRRIMFPIYDVHNNLLGFSGRVYKPEDKNQPKYINSPESIIFKKRNVLFNINNAIIEARKKKRFILCEGQMDVIACDRAGFGEAVCSLGTGLTEEQAKLLKKYAPEVIVFYDNDSAGINASITAISILKGHGLKVKLVRLDAAKDADEYVHKFGEEALASYISDNIMTPYEYQFDIATYSRNLKNEDEFNEAKGEIFNFLKLENSNSTIELYLTKFANITNISYTSLVKDFNEFANKRLSYKKASSPTIEKTNYVTEHIDDKYIRASRRLFGYATLSKKDALYINQEIDINGFDDIHKRIWIEIIDNYYIFNETFDQQKFASMIYEQNDLYEVFKKDINILSTDSIEKYDAADMILCIKTFKEHTKLREIEALKIKLKNEMSPEGKKYFGQKILEIQLELKK